jgi:hypothetical protein
MNLNVDYLRWMLMQEARSLLVRLNQVKPFALSESAVPAAQVSNTAQVAIDRYLMMGRNELRRKAQDYIRWLNNHDGNDFSPTEAQRQLSLLRLGFNATLSQFDIFADALTQRSEYETGVWLAGLDVAAEDALCLDGYIVSPSVICYLDRGAGAAIRRARTRLPGGGENPVAVIRVPRERMVGSGIASSLFHEVGHQAAALLDLVNSLRMELKYQQSAEHNIWQYWERCISEIVADFWSIAQVGITSSLGLIGVVSLPRAFVFRINLDDPHPFPWIRVKLSCAIGAAIYPHPQWQQLADLWESLYPKTGLDTQRLTLINNIEKCIPEFVELLVNHRPQKLRGLSLIEALGTEQRTPSRLAGHFDHWQHEPKVMFRSNPVMAFAVLGQARFEGRLSPEQESALLTKLLRHWALRKNLKTAEICGNSGAEYQRTNYQTNNRFMLSL